MKTVSQTTVRCVHQSTFHLSTQFFNMNPEFSQNIEAEFSKFSFAWNFNISLKVT